MRKRCRLHGKRPQSAVNNGDYEPKATRFCKVEVSIFIDWKHIRIYAGLVNPTCKKHGVFKLPEFREQT